MGKQTITVKTNEEDPEPLELIAESIIKISEGFDKINKSRLERRVIILLLQDATGVNQTTIGKILDAAPRLKDTYVKQLKQNKS